MKDFDPVKLRRGLRLIHCLQRERGASCAYYFSHELGTAVALEPAQKDTDRAIRQLDAPPTRGLLKLRKIIQTEVSFQKIVVCYRALIQNLLHDFIFQQVQQEVTVTKSGTSLPRVKSHHTFAEQTTAQSRSSSKDNLSRSSSGSHLLNMLSSSAPLLDSGHPPSTLGLNLEDPPLLTTSTVTPEEDLVECVEYKEPIKCVSFHEPIDNMTERLWTLLDIVVRLKESTGVERAILLSSQQSSHWVNDVVLEIEQQRTLVADLDKPAVLPHLVQELVRLSPELRSLQTQILNRSANLNVAVTELWEMLTLYIDKLHGLELLIVEELECTSEGALSSSRDYYASSNVGQSEKSTKWLQNWLDVNNPADLRTKLEAMDPVDLKRLMLAKVAPPDALSPSGLARALEHAQESSDQQQQQQQQGGIVERLLQELSSTPSSKEWGIDLYEIRFLRRIGQGTAGTTYLADWNDLKVAVKVASISEMGLDGWRTEVHALQKLHHPNIIRLLGSVYHPDPVTFCLVLEYCDAGDLAGALKNSTPKNFVLHVASGISRGVQYLHQKGVIHRDIKPGNVLLSGNISSGNFEVKVTDFGVASSSDTNEVERTAETGTYRYMAPEVVRHESYSETADVYSFAVVFWQLLTREDPFADRSQIEAAAASALENARPAFPDGVPTEIQALTTSCWDHDPSDRPSFSEISARLSSLSNLLTSEEKSWLDAPVGHSVYSSSLPTKDVDLEPQSERKKLQESGKKQKAKGFRTLFSRKSSPYL